MPSANTRCDFQSAEASDKLSFLLIARVRVSSDFGPVRVPPRNPVRAKSRVFGRVREHLRLTFVHCLVPGGGGSPDGAWMPSRPDYLVLVKALSKIFRGLFVDLAGKALPDITLPKSIWNQKWVAYSKATVQGAGRVLDHLGRYVHRVAITNKGIVSIDVSGHSNGLRVFAAE